jgi:hypothetical protein
MNDRVQQQSLHVDENMSFLAFDQFARIEPVRINAGPPFSALFTLWLSMMQAVGWPFAPPSRGIRRTVHDGSDPTCRRNATT